LPGPELAERHANDFAVARLGEAVELETAAGARGAAEVVSVDIVGWGVAPAAGLVAAGG
jgi:hypothetical protein